MVRIVTPVRDEGQGPVEFDADSKRPSGGSIGAVREAPEARLVMLRVCHREGYRLHYRNLY